VNNKILKNKNLILEAKNLSLKYSDQTVLDNLNFELDQHSFCVLTGPNGAGKTSLVKILVGIETNFSGSLKIFNMPISIFRNNGEIAYLPQRLNQSSLAFPASVNDILNTNLFNNKDAEWEQNILEKLGIANFKNKLISQLSVGQRQRVWLARSLVSKPKLLILDEPTSGVDLKNQAEFYLILEDIVKQGAAIILVTHELETVAKSSNLVWCLNQKLIVHSSVQNFTESSDFQQIYGQSSLHLHHHH
jgi:zinc transport system ATP-binding protein